ncbi:MAG TPA: ribosomal protein S18-alanine N-acetyltransferase [Clostridia bacterium]
MIRPAVIKDIPAIFKLEKECFTDAWSEQNFYEVINSDISRLFVYESDNRIVGYTVVTLIFDEAHLDNIAVDFASRGKGIGKQLVQYVIDFANKNNIHKITLEVRISNTTAINLYKSFGFVVEGVRKNYYMDNEDAYIMWRYDNDAKP